MVDRHYHADLSRRCNNRCVFCMEGSHAGERLERQRRQFAGDYMTPDGLRAMLKRCGDPGVPLRLGGGEPTVNPHLVELIETARRGGCRRIALQTNGRRLSYEHYLLTLIKAGLREVGISIHGSCAAIHDRLTRVTGSFNQTLEGLNNCRRLKGVLPGLRVTTHTTLTRINLPNMEDLLRLLLGYPEIDRVVMNAPVYEGEAVRNAAQIAVSYTQIVQEACRSIAALRDSGVSRLDRLVLADIPPCVACGLEGHLGSFQQYVVMGPNRRRMLSGPKVFSRWAKREACRPCRWNNRCAGVHPFYLKAFGWDEFIPPSRDNAGGLPCLKN